MTELIDNVRHAAENLCAVARNLHTPLDTSTLQAALDALAASLKRK